ncbi:hypothetical protein [Escherichia phage NTNC80A]|uniref:Uncharacterized protein n=1 Tax=Escherichia phage NTNC80A TaxID=2970325 RepID=A0A976SPN1_9CAUD|nr:hypothetical protein [Escherichia phage NTNC80A]
MGVVKKAFKAIGLAPEAPRIEAAKVPAQQLERQPETEAEDVTLGQEDDTTTTSRGKRGLVRPVASSLGV